MFGIGKVLQNVLNEHNIGELAGQLATGSMAELRQSIEALGQSGAISDVGRLLDDLSGQLNASLSEVADDAAHLADAPDEEGDAATGLGETIRDAAASISATATAAADAIGAKAAANAQTDVAPGEMEILPHEAVHTLQGVAVDEDDAVIATEAEGSTVTAEGAHAEPADDHTDD